MQFLITAYDGTDEGALERRMAVREAHLVGARAMKASGSMIIGGPFWTIKAVWSGPPASLNFPTGMLWMRGLPPIPTLPEMSGRRSTSGPSAARSWTDPRIIAPCYTVHRSDGEL